MGVEGVLGGHAPAHDGVQEGLPLSGVEAQHLDGREAGSRRGAENSGTGGEAAGKGPEKAGPVLGQDPSQPRLGLAVPLGRPLAPHQHPLILRGSSRGELFVQRGERDEGIWESGGAGEPHLDVAAHTGKKGWQGFVPVTLQLPPGLSPSTWGAAPPQALSGASSVKPPTHPTHSRMTRPLGTSSKGQVPVLMPPGTPDDPLLSDTRPSPGPG